MAELDDGHDVQARLIRRLPARTGGADLVPRRRVDRGGGVPGREVRLRREPADVARLDRQPRGAERPIPLRLISAVPVPVPVSRSRLMSAAFMRW